MISNIAHDIWHIQTALKQAQNAYDVGEVPVGAVIVDDLGHEIILSHNKKESLVDPTAHAEILAIRECCQKINNWRLSGYTIYVSLEPCLMCMSAIIHARFDRLVFGAYDPKGGALSLGHNLHLDKRLNHSVHITGGLLQTECGEILTKFFKEKRDSKKRS